MRTDRPPSSPSSSSSSRLALSLGGALAMAAIAPIACSSSGSDANAKDEPDAAIDAAVDAAASGTATLEGVVRSPNSSGLDVVPGAILSVRGGGSTIADERGRYRLEVPAGRPIVVEAAPPKGAYPSDATLFGTTAARLSLSAGAHEQASFTLLAGCARTLDAARGSVLDVHAEDCGGGGAAHLEFPPGAFVDASGAAVRGPVLVFIAVAAPARADDLGAIPRDELDAAVYATPGAIEVRLADPAGHPLAIRSGATVTTWFEIAADAPASLRLRWFDPSRGWVEEDAPTIVEREGRRGAELRATHFSTRLVGLPVETRGCLKLRPRSCAGGSCWSGAELDLDFPAQRLHVHRIAGDDACIPVPLGASYSLSLALDNTVTNRSFRLATGGVTSSTAATCPAGCLDLGELALTEIEHTCASGVLTSACGPGCTEPLLGLVDVLAGGRRVSTSRIGPTCSGRVCVDLPLGIGDVALVGVGGRRVDLSQAGATRGAYCAEASPDPDPSCTDNVNTGCLSLGTQSARCAGGACLSPAFTMREVTPSVDCPAPLVDLEMDASTSLGTIGIYEWALENEDQAGAPWFMTGSTRPVQHACIQPGNYRAALRVRSHAGSLDAATTARRITVGGGGGGGDAGAPDGGGETGVGPTSRKRLTMTIIGQCQVLSGPPGIYECGPNATCSATFANGTDVSLDGLTLDTRWSIVSWTGDCTMVPGDYGRATVRMDADKTCTLRCVYS